MTEWSKTIYKFKTVKNFLGNRVIKWLIFGVVASLLLGYVEFLVAIAFQLILKELNLLGETVAIPGFLEPWVPSLTHIFVFFFIIILLRVVLEGIATLSGALPHVVIGTKIRTSVYYELLQRKNPKFVSAADVNFRITEIAHSAASFCIHGISLLNYSVQGIALAIIMFCLTWKATLLGLGLLSLAGIILVKINQSILPIAQQLPVEIHTINKAIQRTVRNWLLVYILRTNNKEYENIVNNELRYRHLGIRIFLLNFLSQSLPQTFGLLLVLVIIFTNIRLLHIDSAIFVSFLYLYLRFVMALSKVSHVFGKAISFFPQFKMAIAYFNELEEDEVEASEAPTRLLSVFKSSPVFRNKRIDSTRNLKEVRNAPSIEFQRVSFSYGKEYESVFKDINLSITPGEQVGVIGRSGSGKSTMLGLILGLLQPTRGKILINDQDSYEFFNQKRLKIGYVGPEPFLMEGSIKDNILYGHFDEEVITDQQINQALKLSQLDKLIQTLPTGLEYKINENGEGLSAGQKQRLALARAVLALPKLLILDEVSANLDAETEFEIAKSIRALKGKCTTLIISHKPGILKFTDHVFDLDQLKGEQELVQAAANS